jgi:integrase
LAAIAVMHRAAGHEAPTAHGVVRATLAGICRERGVAPRPKTALLVGELRAALATCSDRCIDVRDRALLLVGFAGALRRSEFVGLDVGDIRFEGEGVVLQLRRSKTNQEGALEEVAVLYGSDPHTCPVRALQTWLATSGLVGGPLFRAVDRAGRIGAGRLTARIVGQRLKKKIGERCGLDPQSYARAFAAQRLCDLSSTSQQIRSGDHAPGALEKHPGCAPLHPGRLALARPCGRRYRALISRGAQEASLFGFNTSAEGYRRLRYWGLGRNGTEKAFKAGSPHAAARRPSRVSGHMIGC